MDAQTLIDSIEKLGATNCMFVSPKLFVPNETMRDYCHKNKGHGKSRICPPFTETIAEIHERLSSFESGILIQYSEPLEVRNNYAGMNITRLKLHLIVLESEICLRKTFGATEVFGLIGGDCSLCDECSGYRSASCVSPEKARPSLESLGINVTGLLAAMNMDAEFHNEVITWTGMVLFNGIGLRQHAL